MNQISQENEEEEDFEQNYRYPKHYEDNYGEEFKAKDLKVTRYFFYQNKFEIL